jgi:hypothetical protein
MTASRTSIVIGPSALNEVLAAIVLARKAALKFYQGLRKVGPSHVGDTSDALDHNIGWLAESTG